MLKAVKFNKNLLDLFEERAGQVTHYVAPVSWGLGDLIVSLPVIHALIAAQKQTVLVSRSSLQEEIAPRILGLQGCITEALLGKRLMELEEKARHENTIYYNLRDHPLQYDYWWGSPEFSSAFPHYSINDVVNVIASELGIHANFTDLIPLQSSPHPDAKRKIIFVPGTAGAQKYWPHEHWLELADRLQEEYRAQIVVLGEPHACLPVKTLLEAGLAWQPTPTLPEAIDYISGGKLVVSVDTGLMHIAVQQGVPTIGLFRSGSDFYYRPARHSYGLFADQCAEECLKRFSASRHNMHKDMSTLQPQPWFCEVPKEKRCMNTIRPDSILSLIEKYKILG